MAALGREAGGDVRVAGVVPLGAAEAPKVGGNPGCGGPGVLLPPCWRTLLK